MKSLVLALLIAFAPFNANAQESPAYIQQLCAQAPEVLKDIKERVKELGEKPGTELSKRLDLSIAAFLVSLYHAIDADYTKHCQRS